LSIQISGRRIEITDPVRAYVQERGAKLFRFLDRIQKVQFILSSDGDGYSAEVLVSAPKGGQLVAESTEEGLLAAIDKVTDKIERQLRRYKQKLKDHRREEGRSGKQERPVEGEGEPEEEPPA